MLARAVRMEVVVVGVVALLLRCRLGLLMRIIVLLCVVRLVALWGLLSLSTLLCFENLRHCCLTS